MALYRFKSRETGDLVMLQPHGQHVLDIIGKDPKLPGILLPGQMAAAAAALREAVRVEEELQQRQTADAQARGEAPPVFDPVSLRMRSAPFLDMLQRCQKAEVEIVWGV